MKIRNKKTALYLGIGALVIVAVYLVSAVGRALGPIGTGIKTAVGGVNSGITSVLQAVGLDDKQNADVQAVVTAGTSDPWNPGFYQQYFDQGAAIYSKDAGYALVEQALNCQSWSTGVHMDRWQGLFDAIPTKVHFSSFCYWWQKSEGTQLQAWMLNGWLGFISKMPQSDFLTLDQMVQNKPLQSNS